VYHQKNKTKKKNVVRG